MQLATHRRVGFDRDYLGTKARQGGGELSCAGAEVKDPGTGRWLKRPAHCSFGVVGPVSGVRNGCCSERVLKEVLVRVHVTHAISVSTSAPASLRPAGTKHKSGPDDGSIP